MKEIDARGLACPAPVLQTKAALQAEALDRIQVVVDNAPSQQNVQRFLESQGFTTTLSQNGKDYLVIGNGDRQAVPQAPPVDAQSVEAHQKIMVMCTSDRMGYGDDDLGRKLMVNYIRTLAEMGPELWRLVFVNNGVKLTIDGSEVLADLQAYAEKGLEILVCGTCLDHFDLLGQKRVGETTNMLDIVTATQLADKVINL
jgi:selenium metabolism protein YedF